MGCDSCSVQTNERKNSALALNCPLSKVKSHTNDILMNSLHPTQFHLNEQCSGVIATLLNIPAISISH